MRREGWHRALDVQMDTLKWHKTDTGIRITEATIWSLIGKGDLQTRPIGDLDDASLLMAKGLIETLWRADTIYITTEMLHLMLQAAHDLPEDATFDIHTLMSKFGFVLFEEPLQGADNHDNNVIINGLAWGVDRMAPTEEHPEPRDVIVIYFLVDPHDMRDDYNAEYMPKHIAELQRIGETFPPLNLVHMYPALDGSTVPTRYVPGAEIVRETLKLFIAMQLLSHQKIGTPIVMRPDRATRKRYAREHHGMPERMITLITLRRKSVKKDDEEPAKIEWSRRWVVRGHWRKQWYPKSQTHDYVYIHDFIKGPEDKPLVITERRVFNFRR
jgi:hypothetical protein